MCGIVPIGFFISPVPSRGPRGGRGDGRPLGPALPLRGWGLPGHGLAGSPGAERRPAVKRRTSPGWVSAASGLSTLIGRWPWAGCLHLESGSTVAMVAAVVAAVTAGGSGLLPGSRSAWLAVPRGFVARFPRRLCFKTKQSCA